MKNTSHRPPTRSKLTVLRLDLQSFLPRFAIVDTARHADAKRARKVCAGLRAGEIVIFDKAYVDFTHLSELSGRGVWWVSRAKDNLQYQVVQRRLNKPEGNILRDEEIELTVPSSRAEYPKRLRRIVARVALDGQEVEMVFLTNNFQWAASSVAALYKARWQIEVFFKQIRQTLQLADFLGNSANAARWQVWMALLVHVLLGFLAAQSQWWHSFVRLWAVTRSALWLKLELVGLLRGYGTAGGDFRMLGQPEQGYLPGFG